MKASLFYLIFYIASSLFSHIAKNLGKDPFQRIVAHLTTSRASGILNCFITVITDVKRGAVEMTRILGSITIATAKFQHILL